MPNPTITIRNFLASKAAIALLVAFYFAFNAIWLWQHRSSQILDIDEAGYLSIAISYYRALINGGLLGWIQQVEAPSIYAPITTALASLVFALTGPSFVAAIAIPLVGGVITVVASYNLARLLMPASWSLLTAALVASCPIIVIYCRSFHFAMPATAIMTLALICMLRSRQFSSLYWASLFGIFMGLLPLARTMTIAFLPGMIVGAATQVAVSKSEIGRRIWIFGLSLIIAAATAATWLLLNASLVFGYLFNFGYGNRAVEYGSKPSILTIGVWIEMGKLFLAHIYLPHALVLLAGFIAAGVIGLKSLRHDGLSWSAEKMTRSPVFSLMVILFAGIGALASSQNQGSAFTAPLIPLAFVISVYFIQKSLTNSFSRALTLATGGTICLIAAVPLSSTSSPLSYPLNVTLPISGWSAKVTDGRSTIQHYEQAMLDVDNEGQGSVAYSPSEPLSPSDTRAYAALIDSMSRELQRDPWGKSGIAFGFRHFLLNVNSIRLISMYRGEDIWPVWQVEPVVTGDTVAGYSHWLSKGEAANACLLLTMSGNNGQFLPVVTKPFFLQAAKQAGFRFDREWQTPSGQKLGLWRRIDRSRSCEKTKI